MSTEIHELRIPTPGPAGQAWELAATVFLPPALALASGPNLLVLLPGAGYSRGYFDLPVEGASQAAYHAGRGNIIIAIDPLGVGDSSAGEGATVADATAALNAAITYISDGLKGGTLISGLGPVAYGGIVAAGQSFGGHLLLATQAEYSPFRGIALLGTGITGTRFHLPSGGTTTNFAEVDFPYAFHWGEVATVAPDATPRDLATLVGVDVAIGLPARQADAAWASRTFASYTTELLGVSAANAGEITVGVLLGAGERDVTAPLEEEAAHFKQTDDVETFVLPEAAHMHNFAATAEELWKRVDVFIHHALTYGRRTQSDEYMGRFSAAAEDEAEAE